ncbi:hypothetical protein [Halomonas sp. DQ26W]|uniref:hypothetical protein n=1 Tax=Halomonas sp. DQ26W TaxID=2282311 RepID=UPI0015F068AC|nr:hypothetical protein [Halomonas sp. DQ26W]
MASDDTLAVYHGDKPVGRLYDAQPLRFEYALEWQELAPRLNRSVDEPIISVLI